MAASPPPGLFKPAQQGDSLAILVLIENSAAMVDRWPDLRDRYLPTLLGTVRKVNPVVPVCDNTSLPFRLLTERPYLSAPALRFMQIQVIFLPSCRISATEEAIPHSSSSRLSHLPEVRFSHQPNNKITAATVLHAADVGVVYPNLTLYTPLIYLTNSRFSQRLLSRRAQPVTYLLLPHLVHQKLRMFQLSQAQIPNLAGRHWAPN